jgi:formylglycine-generating enzyme required for sulfatase activity
MPNYRIGRYPVTYKQFEAFVKSVKAGYVAATPDLRFGILECEAYWRPCLPDKRSGSTYSSSPRVISLRYQLVAGRNRSTARLVVKTALLWQP